MARQISLNEYFESFAQVYPPKHTQRELARICATPKTPYEMQLALNYPNAPFKKKFDNFLRNTADYRYLLIEYITERNEAQRLREEAEFEAYLQDEQAREAAQQKRIQEMQAQQQRPVETVAKNVAALTLALGAISKTIAGLHGQLAVAQANVVQANQNLVVANQNWNVAQQKRAQNVAAGVMQQIQQLNLPQAQNPLLPALLVQAATRPTPMALLKVNKQLKQQVLAQDDDKRKEQAADMMQKADAVSEICVLAQAYSVEATDEHDSGFDYKALLKNAKAGKKLVLPTRKDADQQQEHQYTCDVLTGVCRLDVAEKEVKSVSKELKAAEMQREALSKELKAAKAAEKQAQPQAPFAT